MADIKSLLKEARKLIDNKSYGDAQECCKNILRKDKQNYLGLVLLGKSLQETDQAALAFQKAIACKSDHPLAWQGLANYYEKKQETATKIKLITVYSEILKLEIDDEKALEVINKLGQLGCSLKDNQSISTLSNYMSNKLSDNVYAAAEQQLIGLLKTDMVCKEEDILNVINYLNLVINKEPSDAMYILLGKVILQKNKFVDALKEVTDLPFFRSSVTFREWLCKFLCKYFVEHNSFSEFDIEKYFDEMFTDILNSKYPGLLKSMILYDKGLFLEAYKLVVPLVNYQEADVTEATFIIRCTFKLNKFTIAQKLATNFLIKVKDPTFEFTLKKFLFLSMAEQQKWQQAITVANELPAEDLDINEQAVLAKCYIENDEKADHVMKNLQNTEHFKQLGALSLIKQEKYEDAIKLLKQLPESSISLYYIGISYWELQQYDKCLLSLLKAAKINADHADTFFYLGMVYQHFKVDLLKAKKCYEKALSLNNTGINIIENLSQIYTKLGLINDDFELLNKASQNIQNDLPQISFRLGLHYINKRSWENAILQFRNVIKNQPSNVIAFECLADSYYSRGSFTSALKAYNKVISMNTKNTLHCLTRIGYIHSLLTQHDDAISTFEKVFKINPSSLLAIKGISETWMRIAKRKFNAKLYGSARDTAQCAINYLTLALSKDKTFLCFWNLLADALLFITKLPSKYSYVYIKNTFTDKDVMGKIDKCDIYPQVLGCYSRIAKQKLQFTSYDLASTYLAYYHATKDIVNCHISYKLTIANIKVNPNSWRNWNLLGKICIFMGKYALAQHCFIKALLVTRKWSVAKIWCNLGTLYVNLGLHKLANYCFWRGQSTLPSYPQSWIGQGLIAEVIQEEEAMDLFRHASRLGYHPESAMGYADWVCRILKSDNYNNSELKYVIDGLYAIPYAMDLVIWFITFEPNNAYANNILGILQERSGLLDSALSSYQKSFQYVEEGKKNIVLLNISRVLLRLEKYDEAIKAYNDVTEANLHSACGLALALYKKGLYEESYSAYDTALHWLSNNDDEKADLLVAMSGIVYMYKGMDDAKTLLFHSIQVSQEKPTPYSLFAICSLGIIHSDQGLSKLALSELQKYEKDNKFGYDIGFLKSYLALNDDINKAITLMSDSLHDHPGSTQLWSCMAQYCLKASDTKAKIASSCAQRALNSTHHSDNDSNSPKMLATASIAEHIAGEKHKSLALAKEGLHMYPCQSEIWAALLFSVLTDTISIERKNWVLSVTGHMRKNLNTTRGLNRWINILEKKLSRYVN